MNPLPSRFVLAATPWSRTGGNRRNSARVSIEGPRRGRVAVDVELPGLEADERRWRGGGVAMGADGALIVVANGRVFRIGLDGRILSVAAIPVPGPDPRAEDGPTEEMDLDADATNSPPDDETEYEPRRSVLAPPVALADGAAVVLAPPELLVFDAPGRLVGGVYVGGTADDSALSPNVTHGGALVLTHMTGEVEWLADGQRRKIGAFGYDVVPPAIYADDAMAIAGYASAGFVCVAADGTRRWSAGLKDADLLPAIDADGFAVVGSQNDQRSIVVAPDGRVVGAIDDAGTFAEGLAGDWFVRTRDTLSRVRRDGSRVWTALHEVSPDLLWGAQAPAADAAGRVYALTPDGLLARDARTGTESFRARLDGAPRAALALVAPGLAAILLEHRLLLIE